MVRDYEVGLSLEQFVERIHASESIVHNWPFKDMPNDERYLSQYLPDNVKEAVDSDENTLVIGQITADNKRISLAVQDSQEYHLVLSDTADKQQYDAWKQLVSVKVGLEVALGTITDNTEREATVTKILGIEQPLATPKTLSSKKYARRKGNSDEGYIQGTVWKSQTPPNPTEIYLGSTMTRAILLYSNTPIRSEEDDSLQDSLMQGDAIRTRVKRSLSPTIFRTVGDSITLLERPSR